MKNSLTWLISVIILVVLACYTFCFQVRYDQVAILTTFDKSTPPTYDAQGQMVSRGSLCLEPGLYPKWPWPIQEVTTYDKRVMMLETQLEELQTVDHYVVIVRLFVAWHIHDPLNFFVKLQNARNAESVALNPLVRDLNTQIGKHRFDELVNVDPTKLQFDAIEKECQTKLQERIDQQSYGITIDRVGLRKVVLPTTVTEKVFARMKQSREALAEQTRSEGDSRATAIKSEATTTQARILAFAESRAQAIRTEGDKAAAEQYGHFAQNEKLAIFLRQCETLRKILANNSTFILPTSDMNALKILDSGPSADAKTASNK